MLDAEAQGRGAGRGSSLIVLRAPFRHASALTDAERAVDDDARRRVAIDEPGWRRACTARSNWLSAKLKPPTSASTRPVCGSMATIAPLICGTCSSDHCPVTSGSLSVGSRGET